MKTKEGEYIPLIWDGDPEYFYVRGHVPLQEAKAVIEKEDGLSFHYADAGGIFEIDDGAHTWARWSCQSDHECGLVLRDCNGPGRGIFTVTRFKVTGKKYLWEKTAEGKKSTCVCMHDTAKGAVA